MATGARNSTLRQQIVATQIAAGDDFTAILSECGNIYTWGKNNHGQLGHGHFRNQTSPVAVSGVRTRMRQISCGSHFMAAVSEHGALYNWGGGLVAILSVDCDLHPVVPFPAQPSTLSAVTHLRSRQHAGHRR